jgi:hypothetical protein
MNNAKTTFNQDRLNNFKVFLDMDGVLVNWNKGYLNVLKQNCQAMVAMVGFDPQTETPYDFDDKLYDYFLENGYDKKHAKSKAKKEFWKPIHGNIDFWLNLEWMPDGIQLFNFCLALKKNKIITELNILSSPSSDAVCEQGKRQWLKNQGIEKHLDQIIIAKDKYKYATNEQSILIDDTPKKIYGDDKTPGWVTVGGTGILHKSASESIAQLEKILKENNE